MRFKALNLQDLKDCILGLIALVLALIVTVFQLL